MVNRMRHTKSKTARRRSHHRADAPTLTQESGVARLRHRASRTTGMYRGRQVLNVADKLAGEQSPSPKEEKKSE